MGDLITLLLPFLSSGDFIEKVVGGLVIYFVARREVRAQFKSVNDHLSEIASQLKIFGTRIVELETKHDARFVKLETKVTSIERDVIDIKIKTQVHP